ncbi:NACHT domain- and WD repeat-containing protein 1-like [Amphiura filiformis]|uniref:NACHT domain- and WD repeat-containing protein 1-like n=1 Tax=Amphiura filiformis TaxID=82378 RepID=UPI003B21594B
MFLGEFSKGTIRPITLTARGKAFDNADRHTSLQPLVFGDDVFNLRKLQELPYHLAEASMDDALAEQVLFNFNWLLTKLRAFSFLELMSDFQNTSDEVREPQFTVEMNKLEEMMYLASSNLKSDPFTLAGQLIGRLSDTRKDFHKLDELLNQAKNWVDGISMPLMSPRSTCLMPPGGPMRVTLAGHPTRVLKVACTRSNKYLVSACEDSQGHIMANVWDSATWEVIQTIHMNNSVPNLKGHLAMAISNDDRYLILAHRCLGIFDLTNGECLNKIEIDNSLVLTDVKTTDGLIMAGSMDGNRVYVWNITDGSNLLQLELPGTSSIPHVFLRNASSHVVAVRADANIHIIDLETKRTIWECPATKGNSDLVTSSILTSDEQEIIAGCSDGVIRVWQLEHDSEQPRLLLTGHKKSVTKLLINSKYQLISGSLDATLRVWELSNGSALFTLSGHDGAITCMTFIPNYDDNDEMIVSGSKDDKLKVWNTATGTLMNNLEGHSSWISDVTVVDGTHGMRVISACNDKTVKIWLPTQVMPSSLSRHDEGPPRCIAVATSGRYVTTSALKGVTKVWNANDGRCFHDIKIESKCLLTWPGKDYILGGDSKGQIHCWNLLNGEEVWSYIAHTNPITHLCWGASMELISAGGSEAKLWNVSLSEPITSPQVVFAGHDDDITTVAVTKKEESNLVVTACKKGVLKIWSYDSGECCQTVSLNTKIECLAISRNNRYLATGSKDGTVAVWCLEAERIGQQISTSHLSDDTVVCLVFTMDDKHLICGLFRGTKQLYMWDFQAQGQGSSRYLEGHHHAVQVAKLLSNGEYLLTSSRDCTLKIWHVASGKLVTSFDCQSQIKFCDVVEIGEHHWLVAAATKMAMVFLDATLTKQAGHKSFASGNGDTIKMEDVSASEPKHVTDKNATVTSAKETGRIGQRAPRSKACKLF